MEISACVKRSPTESKFQGMKPSNFSSEEKEWTKLTFRIQENLMNQKKIHTNKKTFCKIWNTVIFTESWDLIMRLIESKSPFIIFEEFRFKQNCYKMMEKWAKQVRGWLADELIFGLKSICNWIGLLSFLQLKKVMAWSLNQGPPMPFCNPMPSPVRHALVDLEYNFESAFWKNS